MLYNITFYDQYPVRESLGYTCENVYTHTPHSTGDVKGRSSKARTTYSRVGVELALRGDNNTLVE